MPRGNPFTIYFITWGGIFFLYIISSDDWIGINDYLLLSIVVTNVFVSFFMIVIMKYYPVHMNDDNHIHLNRKLILIGLFICVISLYPMFIKANEIAGTSIFSIYGYTKLRWSIVFDDKSYGFLSYISTLSTIITSLYAVNYNNNKHLFFVSFIVSIVYCFLMTGRTYFLLLIILIIIPLLVLKKIKIKTVLLSAIFILFVFILMAALLNKGADLNNDFYDNINGIILNFRSYTVAPFVALSELLNNQHHNVLFAENILRTPYLIVNKIFNLNMELPSLIREYTATPFYTNVYTVYDPYYRDFGYIGFFFVPMFMLIHYVLFFYSCKKKGIYVFLYAASIYPLMMQFFQDQYFSLLSKWIQVFVFYFIFIKKDKSYE